jgi:hypothetical protein
MECSTSGIAGESRPNSSLTKAALFVIGGRVTVDRMTAKEQLRTVVDELSEHEAADTLAFIARRRDALGELLASAPLDDEPTTSDEDAGAAQAWTQIARGEVFSAEDIRREFA